MSRATHREDQETGRAVCLLGLVDRRCSHRSCGGKSIYRMVGFCRNCGSGPLLMLFTSGHQASPGECPLCGCCDAVYPERLAAEEEIPAAVVYDRKGSS
jgi:hypothetical protein